MIEDIGIYSPKQLRFRDFDAEIIALYPEPDGYGVVYKLKNGTHEFFSTHKSGKIFKDDVEDECDVILKQALDLKDYIFKVDQIQLKAGNTIVALHPTSAQYCGLEKYIVIYKSGPFSESTVVLSNGQSYEFDPEDCDYNVVLKPVVKEFDLMNYLECPDLLETIYGEHLLALVKNSWDDDYSVIAHKTGMDYPSFYGYGKAVLRLKQ